jgi:hypothetical protein
MLDFQYEQVGHLELQRFVIENEIVVGGRSA